MIHSDSKTRARFHDLGSQREADNPLVVVIFIIKREGMHCYATEYDPGTKTFYGYVRGSDCDGYQSFGFNKFNEQELREVSTYLLREPQPIQSLIPELNRNLRKEQLHSMRSISLSGDLKERTL